MKRIIKVFIFLFSFIFFSSNVKAFYYNPEIYDSHAIIINEDGSVTYNPDSSHVNVDPSNYFKFENDVLYIYDNDDAWAFYNLVIKKNIKIVMSDNVRIINLFTTDDVLIQGETEDSIVNIEMLDAIKENVSITYKDSNIKLHDIHGFENVNIDNCTGYISSIKPSVDYDQKSWLKTRTEWKEHYGWIPITNLYIRNSNLTITDAQVVGEDYIIEDSTIELGIHMAPHSLNYRVINSTIRGSDISVINLYSMGSFFENSTIDVAYMFDNSHDIDEDNDFVKKQFDTKNEFINCNVNVHQLGRVGLILDNTIFKSDIFEPAFIIMENNSYLEVNNITSYDQFLYMKNSKLKFTESTNGFDTMPDQINEDNCNILDDIKDYMRYDLTLINSSLEDISGTWNLSSFYIENSNANLPDLDMTHERELPEDISTNKMKKSIIKNSDISINKILAEYDLDFIDSNIVINTFKPYYHFELDRYPILTLNNTDMLVNGNESDIGLDIFDLNFINSHLISKGNENAFLSRYNVIAHNNIIGVNLGKNVIPYKNNFDIRIPVPFEQTYNVNDDTITVTFPDGSIDTLKNMEYISYGNVVYHGDVIPTINVEDVPEFSFYDNNEISKYVEIRTPLKVTFKIKNGTWKDGTTEDKIVESYYFGSINEVDVPKEMIASDGYENGSWDKEIIYDELKDEYVYTYEFKPKGVEPEKKESPKKEEKKEEKKTETKVFKNPNTGAFLSLTTIGILTLLCLKILKYTKSKKYFNKI